MGGIAGVFADAGFFLPARVWPRFRGRARGPGDGRGRERRAGAVRFGRRIRPVASVPSTTPSTVPTDPPLLANVAVGKSTLMHCQDPPAAELKPSKCGEPALDPVLVPKIEALGRCPAAAGITGKLALHVDLDFKKQVAKVVAGKGSADPAQRPRDDKAIEPLLQCLRASLKELLRAREPRRRRPRPSALGPRLPGDASPRIAAAPAPSASVEKEKAATGVVTVQVDTAIVRDAPSTSGQPIGRLSRGTKISTIGTAGNWYHVKFGDNDAQEGWIFRTNIGGRRGPASSI